MLKNKIIQAAKGDNKKQRKVLPKKASGRQDQEVSPHCVIRRLLNIIYSTKALKSNQDAHKVMVYAETGNWPFEKDEQSEKRKAFIRRFPELLIKVPENQDLFDEEELKVLLQQINEGL